MKRILDATCGSRMIWFNKQNPDVLYMDNRKLTTTLCDGRMGYFRIHGSKILRKDLMSV